LVIKQHKCGIPTDFEKLQKNRGIPKDFEKPRKIRGIRTAILTILVNEQRKN
jgi:hypothetical protein